MEAIAKRGEQTLWDLGNGRGAIEEDGFMSSPRNIMTLINQGYWEPVEPHTEPNKDAPKEVTGQAP